MKSLPAALFVAWALSAPAFADDKDDKDDGLRQAIERWKKNGGTASDVAELAEFGPKAVPFLAEILRKDKSAQVRYAVAAAFVELGPRAKAAVPALVGALKDEGLNVSAWAAGALREMGPDARAAVPALIGMVKDTSAGFDCEAVEILGRIGPDAAAAVPLLVESLEYEHPKIRRCVAAALGDIGFEAKPAVAALTRVLQDKDEKVRTAAAEALAKIKTAEKSTPAERSFRHLIKRLKHQDPIMRRHAAEALGEMGPAAKAAVPALAEALRDEVTDVRHYAAAALGRIGPEAKSAVPALIEAFEDAGEEAVGAALVQIGASASIGPLIAALTHHKDAVRLGAAEALALFGREALVAVPALTQALPDEVEYVRRAIKDATARITIAVLIGQLREGDLLERRYAAHALGQMGALARALEFALGKFSSAVKAAVPELIRLLADPDTDAVLLAAYALGEIGPGAESALPALAALAKDKRAEVRDAAAAAKKKIENREE